MTQGVRGSTPACSIAGCVDLVHGRGLCNLHYKRKLIHGDPTVRLIREAGEGTPHIDGYWVLKIGGKSKLRHIVIAERALGRPLPKGAQVHHADEDRSNDSNDNLVICPNYAYHKLLHTRADALRECGNANWIRCWICKKHGAPEDIKIAGSAHFHPACQSEYVRARRLYRLGRIAA